jgi:drug/metabolite transporter (DMT)-like permease
VTDLIFAVLCSSSIAILFALSESMQLNRYAVTTVNYAAAAVVGAVTAAAGGVFRFRIWSAADFIAEFTGVLGSGGSFSPSAAPLWAVSVGLVTGWLFVAAFLLYQYSVRLNGASLSGMFGKLGILLPVLLSLLVWRDFPDPGQWAGIALAAAALALPSLSVRGGKKVRERVPLLLALLFLAMGAAEFSNKLFQAYAAQELSPLFLSVLFASAFLASFALLILTGKGFGLKELLLGLAVGIPNLFSSYFLIRALDSIKAAVAFPFFSVGSMSLIALAGVILFRERLSRFDYAGLILAACALLLLA